MPGRTAKIFDVELGPARRLVIEARSDGLAHVIGVNGGDSTACGFGAGEQGPWTAGSQAVFAASVPPLPANVTVQVTGPMPGACLVQLARIITGRSSMYLVRIGTDPNWSPSAREIPLSLPDARRFVDAVDSAARTAAALQRAEWATARSAPVLLETEVDRVAREDVAGPRPAYPPGLRAHHVEGDVLAQFIVDDLGHPLPATLVVLRSTHPLFERAVRDALPSMRFFPAEKDGRSVMQVVQMFFHFAPPPLQD